MAPGSVNILMHYGGSFSHEGRLRYIGGQVSIFQNIDTDIMSYFHVLDLAKSVGFKDGDTLFYAIPGRTLDLGGIDHLKDDTSVSEMLNYVNQTNYLEVYIKHNEQAAPGHPSHGVGDQQNHSTEVMLILSSSLVLLQHLFHTSDYYYWQQENISQTLTKFPRFSRDQIVKAARITGKDETMLNLFFSTPEEFKSEFISQTLEV